MSRPRPEDIHRELELHHKEFYGWALYCSYEDKQIAADILQTAYLKILEKHSSFEGKSDFRTWAFRIIKNTAHDFSRARKKREKLFSLNDQLPETDQVLTPESAIDKAKKDQVIKMALDQLSSRQKQIIQLLFYHDFSLNEAAAVLGISGGSARKHYSRAKDTLGEWLQKKGITNLL